MSDASITLTGHGVERMRSVLEEFVHLSTVVDSDACNAHSYWVKQLLQSVFPPKPKPKLYSFDISRTVAEINLYKYRVEAETFEEAQSIIERWVEDGAGASFDEVYGIDTCDQYEPSYDVIDKMEIENV